MKIAGAVADAWILAVLLGFLITRVLESEFFRHSIALLHAGAAR